MPRLTSHTARSGEIVENDRSIYKNRTEKTIYCQRQVAKSQGRGKAVGILVDPGAYGGGGQLSVDKSWKQRSLH